MALSDKDLTDYIKRMVETNLDDQSPELQAKVETYIKALVELHEHNGWSNWDLIKCVDRIAIVVDSKVAQWNGYTLTVADLLPKINFPMF